MSAFLTELVIRLKDPQANDHTGMWQIEHPLVYSSDHAGQTLTVPFGFATDLASVPRESIIAWGLFGGRAMRAAVVHDWLVRQRWFQREKCDRIFLEAMQVDGVPIHKAMPMYLAVSAYTATGAWKKDYDDPGYEPIG